MMEAKSFRGARAVGVALACVCIVLFVGAVSQAFTVVPSPCTVSGGGIIAGQDSRSTLFVDIKRDSGGVLAKDVLRMSCLRPRELVISTGITSLNVNGGTATITGNCTLNGNAGYTYEAIIVDNSPDSFTISVWDSVPSLVVYVSGSISRGNFIVTSP